jgi:hypothetical protein
MNPKVYTYVRDMAPSCATCGVRSGRHWYTAEARIEYNRGGFMWQASARTRRGAIRRLRREMVDPKRVDS